LEIGGEVSGHLCAFARNRGDEAVVVAVPRLVYQLYKGGPTAEWGATEIAVPPRAEWEDVFTGRKVTGDKVRAAELLADFPVAVLAGQPG
jgi:maltooligosyltrehalose synthase